MIKIPYVKPTAEQLEEWTKEQNRREKGAAIINAATALHFGVHLVTCGSCGCIQQVVPNNTSGEETCEACGFQGDPCDFPDLFF